MRPAVRLTLVAFCIGHNWHDQKPEPVLLSADFVAHPFVRNHEHDAGAAARTQIVLIGDHNSSGRIRFGVSEAFDDVCNAVDARMVSP